MRADFYVYCWTNATNGKRYVGKGRGPRATRHKEPARRSPLALAIQKYGVDSFALEYLVEGLTEPEAFTMETHFINRLGSVEPSGYNLTLGGEGTSGHVKSSETRSKLSRALKGKKHNAAHVHNQAEAQRGKVIPEEQRAKMSAAKLGKKPAPQAYAALRGLPKSEEHKAKIRAALVGRPKAAESVAKSVAAKRARRAEKQVIAT